MSVHRTVKDRPVYVLFNEKVEVSNRHGHRNDTWIFSPSHKHRQGFDTRDLVQDGGKVTSQDPS